MSIVARWVVICDGCGKRPNTTEYFTYTAALQDLRARWPRWHIRFRRDDDNRYVHCPKCFAADVAREIEAHKL